jgi:hypothetical protein
MQGDWFPGPCRRLEQGWSWPKRDNAAGWRLSLECEPTWEKQGIVRHLLARAVVRTAMDYTFQCMC